VKTGFSEFRSIAVVDFDWTPEQNAAHDRVRDAAAAWEKSAGGTPEIGAPDAPDAFSGAPRSAFFTPEEWRRCAAAGVLGLSVPASYGGAGLDALGTAHAAEAFGRGCPDLGLVFSAMAHLLACATPIAEHGSPGLRAAVLPRLCSGEWVGANAITEDGAGSDVTALTTRAEARPDGSYVLAGEKSFVSNGPVADLFLVYATTDPRFGHLGLTAFAVERGFPGVRPGAAFAKLGPGSCPAGRLVLDGCRVPATHVVGRPGTGAAVFQSSMGWERTCLFAAYLGAGFRILDRCVHHAATRRQFGRPIGDNQAVSHRLADLRTRLEAARLLVLRACWTRDRGHPATAEIAMAKLAAAEAVADTALESLRLFAGAGVRADSGVARDLADALPGTIFSGTSDLQREVLAKAMGL
jgi:alkylation response protein AidB-like acyl-CoA dehydrogenase